ncbi:outer membrane protein assembly factor BamD [bacterium]|nr:outer membrane protein assembly factor BamD [bacterium]
MMKKIFLFVCFVNLVFLFSCSKTPIIRSTESDADKIYQEGLFYLDKGDLTNAENRFMSVISDFSYSKYESFATVALGKTYYKKEEYMSAITVLETFLKRHPNHELAPEALLYKGHSYLAQKPSDFFILPNPAERDISVVEQAVAVYREYIEKYPDDINMGECVKKLEEAEGILIEKDLRIAEFYAKRKKCAGVFLRLQHIENNFKVTTEKNLKRIEELNAKCPPKSKEEYFKIEKPKDKEETFKEGQSGENDE